MEPDITIERVRDEEIPVWAHLTTTTLPDMDVGPAEYAAQFARATAANRDKSYLAWWTDAGGARRAVARLRMMVRGDLASSWGWGLAQAAPPGSETALVRAVEAWARGRGARLLSVGVDARRRSLLERAGYRLARSRTGMTAAAVAGPVVCDRLLRHPRPEDERDVRALGRLYYDAYHGTIDDDGESPEDTLASVRSIFAGDLGPFLADCSWVVEGDGEPAGAVLVTDDSDGTALVAEVMIGPRYRGRGYARPMIQAVMNACLERGWTRMVLMVTRGNVPAEGLYRRMGFSEDPAFEEYQMEKELEEQP